MPLENWTVRAFLQLTPHLSNDFTAAWLTFTFPQLFAVAATLKSIDYNVAITFILNNNNNNNNAFSALQVLWRCTLQTDNLFACTYLLTDGHAHQSQMSHHSSIFAAPSITNARVPLQLAQRSVRVSTGQLIGHKHWYWTLQIAF